MAIIAWALTTLQKTKDYLGITGTDATRDAVIEGLINSVTDWIESQIGRRLKETTHTNELYDGGGNRLFLKNYPASSVSSVQYKQGSLSNPTWQDFSADDWQLLSKRGEIYFPAGMPEGVENIRVSYTAGYKIDFANETNTALHTLPFDIELLAKQLVAKAYNQRKADGKSNESVEGSSIGWDRQISEEQKQTILKYRNLAI